MTGAATTPMLRRAPLLLALIALYIFATVATAHDAVKPTAPVALRPLSGKQTNPAVVRPLRNPGSSTPVISPQIIGGTTAASAAWPYLTVVSIHKSNGYYICTGERIAALWVLTAAHCVYDANVSAYVSPGSVAVGLGQGSYSTRTDWQPVQQVVPNPSYNPTTAYADLTLLRIPASAPDTQVVNVASASDEPTSTPAIVWIAGWGLTVDGGTPADLAQNAATFLWGQSYCGARWGVNIDLTSELCAGGPDGIGGLYPMPCNGDSGGPLVLSPGPDPWNDELLGTTDYGSALSCESLPTVFQRVSFWYPWIVGTTGLGPVTVQAVQRGANGTNFANLSVLVPPNEADATLELVNPLGQVVTSSQLYGDMSSGYITLRASGLSPGTQYGGYSVVSVSHYGNFTFSGVSFASASAAALVGKISCPSRQRVGRRYACKLSIANRGPNRAERVNLLLKVGTSRAAIVCRYSSIAVGTKACTVRVRPTRTGRVTYTLSVTSSTYDSNRHPGASQTVRVTR
jgi:Trypsin